MKFAGFAVFCLVMLSSSFVLAIDEDASNFLDDVLASPDSYVVVIGSGVGDLEILMAANLAGLLGTSNVLIDNEVTHRLNLIVLGDSSNNKIIQELSTSNGGMFISDNNLFVVGSSKEDFEDILYEVDNYVGFDDDFKKEGSGLSSSNILLRGGLLVVLVILIIFMTIFIVRSLNNNNHNLKMRSLSNEKNSNEGSSMSDDELYLTNYIQSNLKKGIKKEALRRTLVEMGWDVELVDEYLGRFNGK